MQSLTACLEQALSEMSFTINTDELRTVNGKLDMVFSVYASSRLKDRDVHSKRLLLTSANLENQREDVLREISQLVSDILEFIYSEYDKEVSSDER